MEDGYIVVLTTVEAEQAAADLARSIVSAGLAACVQMHAIRGVYRWKGEVHDGAEWVLAIKTAEHRYADLEDHIRTNHAYETPEIVKLPILGGARSYLAWIGECVA